MADYDFTNLSDYDFEQLCQDVLSAELGIRLESFTRGRDQGIDLRSLGEDEESSFIIQCKHYFTSGYNKLFSHLKNEELAKLSALKPERYGLATSVPLTAKRKKDLSELLSPYLRQSDIWGNEDLNALLRKYPHVERAHFKLWLASTQALQAVLHAGVLRRSVEVAREIADTAKVYVKTDRYARALDLLSQYHVCILAGPPGVGKSTIAQMLIATLARDGYNVIVASENVDEVEGLYADDEPQVIFYDDFLGQVTSAELLGKNEDKRLLSLIQRVGRSPNKRLILASREHLLREAAARYERLEEGLVAVKNSVLRVYEYTRIERAHILYNHVFFAGLSASARASLLNGDAVLKIVDHRNYSPRVIAQVAQFATTQGADGPDFAQFALRMLSDPRAVWSKPFANQLDPLGRSVLLTLVTLPGFVELRDVRDAARTHAPSAFAGADDVVIRRTLRTLENTFITTRSWSPNLFLRLRGPSVRDFLLAQITSDELSFTDAAQHAIFFEQIDFLAGLLEPPRWDFSRSETATAAHLDNGRVRSELLSGFARTLDARSVSWRSSGRLTAPDNARPVRVPPLFERRILRVAQFAAGSTVTSVDWGGMAQQVLEREWDSGSGHVVGLAELVNKLDILPVNVTSWLRGHDTLPIKVARRCTSTTDFLAARSLLSTLSKDLTPLEAAFITFVDEEIGKLERQTGTPELAERFFELEEALGVYQLEPDDRLDHLRESAEQMAEAISNHEDMEFERYREDQWEARAEAAAADDEIRDLFRGLT